MDSITGFTVHKEFSAYNIPLTPSCLIISNFSLCGIPFLAGFYSKDLISEITSFRYLNIFVFFLFGVNIFSGTSQKNTFISHYSVSARVLQFW